MACDCAALRVEVLSQREFMTRWFQMLVIKLDKVQQHNSRLEEQNEKLMTKVDALNYPRDSVTSVYHHTDSDRQQTLNHFRTEESEGTPEDSQTSTQIDSSTFSVQDSFNKESEETGLRYPPHVPKQPKVEHQEEGISFSGLAAITIEEENSVDGFRAITVEDALPGRLRYRDVVSQANDEPAHSSMNTTDNSYSAQALVSSLLSPSVEHPSCSVDRVLSQTSTGRASSPRITNSTFELKPPSSIRRFSHQKPEMCNLLPNAYVNTNKAVKVRKKPYACNQCDYRASNKWHLDRHLMSIHLKEKPFHCRFCDYRSSTKWNLKTHERHVHHKDPYY